MNTDPATRSAAAKPVLKPDEAPAIEAHVLLAGGRERVILHDGARYRLRITAKGKLLLTK